MMEPKPTFISSAGRDEPQVLIEPVPTFISDPENEEAPSIIDERVETFSADADETGVEESTAGSIPFTPATDEIAIDPGNASGTVEA